MYVSDWTIKIVGNTVTGSRDVDRVLLLHFTYDIEQEKVTYFLTPCIKWRGCKYEFSKSVFSTHTTKSSDLANAIKLVDDHLIGLSIIRRGTNFFEVQSFEGSLIMTVKNSVIKIYEYPHHDKRSIVAIDLKRVGKPTACNYPVVAKTRIDACVTSKIEYLYRISERQ